MKNQWLIFDIIVVLDIPNMIDSSDFGCGTEKWDFEACVSVTPNYRPVNVHMLSTLMQASSISWGRVSPSVSFLLKTYGGILRNPHKRFNPLPNKGFSCLWGKTWSILCHEHLPNVPFVSHLEFLSWNNEFYNGV